MNNFGRLTKSTEKNDENAKELNEKCQHQNQSLKNTFLDPVWTLDQLDANDLGWVESLRGGPR